MRLVVFDDARLGLVRDDGVVDVSDLVGAGRAEWPPVFSLRAIADFDRLRPRLTEPLGTRPGLLLSEVHLAAPVVFPSKVIAAPVNYRLHIEEMRPRSRGAWPRPPSRPGPGDRWCGVPPMTRPSSTS